MVRKFRELLEEIEHERQHISEMDRLEMYTAEPELLDSAI